MSSKSRLARHLGVSRQSLYYTPRRPKRDKEYAMQRIPNRLDTILPCKPNTVWAGDFTYLWFHGRYIYLAMVIDLCTREILAWQIALHHTSGLVVDVLKEALERRGKSPKVFHSDQGSKYASQSCVQRLVKHEIQPSWSPKGKPWINGRQESFFSSFKLEFGKAHRFVGIDDLIEGIGKYIHYYNKERIHGSLKMPPRTYYKKEDGRNAEY